MSAPAATSAAPSDVNGPSVLPVRASSGAATAVVVTGAKGVRKLEQRPSVQEIEAAVDEVS